MKQFLITVAGVLVGLVLFLFIGPILLLSMIAASSCMAPAQPAHMVLSLDLREPMTDQRPDSAVRRAERPPIAARYAGADRRGAHRQRS